MKEPLNIVLLTIDCWRGDHLGTTNGASSPTPHLDQLAAEGIVFEQAITCGGWTRPAMMALFSSVYASQHNDGSLRQISPELPVLAEVLQAQGYETAGFTANMVCGCSAGFDRGFDTFADLKTNHPLSVWWRKLIKIRGLGRITAFILSQTIFHRLLQSLGVRYRLPEAAASAQQVTDEVLAWLDGTPATPFLLWAHYIDLHWPYRLSRRSQPNELAQAYRDRRIYPKIVQSHGHFDPGAETRERWQTLYREELMTVDEQVGRLIAYLRDSDQWERTIIVVTSDHGEEFREHGTWAHSWNQLFDEGVLVPLVVRVPDEPGGHSIRQQVSLLDVAPTVLDLVEIEPLATMLGVSLAPLLNGKQDSKQARVRPEAIIEMLGHTDSYSYRMAVRTETHRYIHDIEHPFDNQLYDRHADPREHSNKYNKEDSSVRRFDALRFKHMAPIIIDLLEVEGEDAFADTDPEVVERLRALGYIE